MGCLFLQLIIRIRHVRFVSWSWCTHLQNFSNHNGYTVIEMKKWPTFITAGNLMAWKETVALNLNEHKGEGLSSWIQHGLVAIPALSPAYPGHNAQNNTPTLHSWLPPHTTTNVTQESCSEWQAYGKKKTLTMCVDSASHLQVLYWTIFRPHVRSQVTVTSNT